MKRANMSAEPEIEWGAWGHFCALLAVEQASHDSGSSRSHDNED